MQEGQLNLFSLTDELGEKNTEKKEGILEEEKGKPRLRPFPSIDVGDKVKVSKPIDNSPENQTYFERYKTKKGIVTEVQQVPEPKNYLYQFNVRVQFEKEEVGIFYDLELEVIV
ncbi:hypothetical protein [Virgibacillus halodenitrificans]|uniref:hypothetical protein n=1 Tax=Virgibacillus halodenitrificans TaxID=1482 RepID=UPI000EF47820|nr:hypothetical protein [Virgibacillus halodenitrificans]